MIELGNDLLQDAILECGKEEEQKRHRETNVDLRNGFIPKRSGQLPAHGVSRALTAGVAVGGEGGASIARGDLAATTKALDRQTRMLITCIDAAHESIRERPRAQYYHPQDGPLPVTSII